ncbi:MAG TPA: tetratricopeptide repeat protein [Xanthobacteraceae bacterium]|nr:tetratricopeptide repeat protein [Xanthobacteraceae bacterium]
MSNADNRPNLQTAFSLHQAGKLDAAARIYRQILRREPDNFQALHYLGIVEASVGNLAQAKSLMARSLRLQPSNIQFVENYATILCQSGDYESALGVSEQGLRFDGSNVALLYVGAIALFKLKRLEDSIARFDRLLLLQPNHIAAINERGSVLAAMNKYDAALASFQKALTLEPRYAEAHLNCGNLYGNLKRYGEAAIAYDKALALKPNLAEAWLGRGNVLLHLKSYDGALAAFDKALALKADLADAWLGRGNVFYELRRYDDGLAAYDRALALKPDLAEAWLGRGNVVNGLKRYDDALAAYDKALALKPDLANAWLGRGNVFNELKRSDEAFAAIDRALALEPDLAEAWHGRGNVFDELKRYDDALAAYDKALALKPDLAEAWLGRGNVFYELKRRDDASAAFDKALTLKPDLANAWLGRGNVCYEFKRYDDALAAYDRALALKPDLAGAWLGRGNVFYELKRHDDALAAHDRALALAPGLAEAWFSCGNVLNELKRYGDAFAAFDKAVALKPDLDFAVGARLFAKLNLCDWTNRQAETAQLLSMIGEQILASTPFWLLAVESSPADQLRCASRYQQSQPNFTPLWRGEIYSHDRIRVAYLSADFREHAVGYLTAGLFEHHDKSRFEITALSLVPDQDSPTRDRIKRAVEHFIDVRRQDDGDIAELIRRHEIDIVIDLMGFTAHSRHGVLARRAAPVQVNYLGYSGTAGAGYIDYIVADPTVIPEDQCGFYTEQVIWLAESYLVNDDRRAISERTPTRRECGLPDDTFVYCCFNNSYKLAPETFQVWMRLLNATPDSVLWLSEANPAAQANLRREADRCGVSAQRLIFAARMPAVADHLARQRHADLFLDTLPYNAHTTACDALWAGVPIVTCLGASFVGRVAASLLKAVGLDELITHSLEDYETLALKLAREPAYLASVRDRLERNRTTFPLFNTERTTRQIEAAYTMMWQRYQSGERTGPRSGPAKPIRVG